MFVGLFCKRCQRSQCFQMHLSMLCTCWYLQILFAFFLLLPHLPLCWYFCHLDTVFAASIPPFLLTSATRGALVLKHNPTIFMQMFQIYDFWLCNKNYFQAAFSFQHSTRNTSNYFQTWYLSQKIRNCSFWSRKITAQNLYFPTLALMKTKVYWYENSINYTK